MQKDGIDEIRKPDPDEKKDEKGVTMTEMKPIEPEEEALPEIPKEIIAKFPVKGKDEDTYYQVSVRDITDELLEKYEFTWYEPKGDITIVSVKDNRVAWELNVSCKVDGFFLYQVDGIKKLFATRLMLIHKNVAGTYVFRPSGIFDLLLDKVLEPFKVKASHLKALDLVRFDGDHAIGYINTKAKLTE